MFHQEFKYCFGDIEGMCLVECHSFYGFIVALEVTIQCLIWYCISPITEGFVTLILEVTPTCWKNKLHTILGELSRLSQIHRIMAGRLDFSWPSQVSAFPSHFQIPRSISKLTKELLLMYSTEQAEDCQSRKTLLRPCVTRKGETVTNDSMHEGNEGKGGVEEKQRVPVFSLPAASAHRKRCITVKVVP